MWPPRRMHRWPKEQLRLVTPRQKPNRRRDPGPSQRSRSQHGPNHRLGISLLAAAAALVLQTPVTWSARPRTQLKQSTPRLEGSLSRLPLPRRRNESRRITSCRSPCHDLSRRVRVVKCLSARVSAVLVILFTFVPAHRDSAPARAGALSFPIVRACLRCTLCAQVPLQLGECAYAGPMKLPMCLPWWLGISVMVYHTLYRALWLLTSSGCLQKWKRAS